MWTCPKCGREFKNNNQSHYCGNAPVSIEEYIKSQDMEKQPMLIDLYNAIREAMPDALYKISWSMPAFYKGKANVLCFAANKRHIGFYIGTQAVEQFSEKLEGYKAEKGNVHIPYERPLPQSVVTEICEWCYKNTR